MSDPMPAIRFTAYNGFDNDIFKAVEAGDPMKAAFSHVIGSNHSSLQSGVDLDGDGVAEFSIGRYGAHGARGARDGGDGIDFNYCRRTVVPGPFHSVDEGSEWYPCNRGSVSRTPAWNEPRMGSVITWLLPEGGRGICIGNECASSDQPAQIKLSSSYGKLPGPLGFGAFVYVGDFNGDGLADFAVGHDLSYAIGRSYSIYLQVKDHEPAAIEESPY
jgi:hypothetical protein